MTVTTRITPESVRQQILEILSAWGMSESDAENTAAAMVDTDLRGIDSHGISMLMTYNALYQRGGLYVTTPRVILAETPAIASMDAGGGLGHPAAVQAMNMAIEKAQNVGIGAVAVRHSHHFGALGYYVRMAAEKSLFGFVTTSTRLQSVVPTGSRQSILGTNPIAFAAPSSGAPFVVDMSTSVVASNKIRSYALKGLPVPEGWVLGSNGESLTDASIAYEAIENDPNAGLTPLGGPTTVGGGHKGSGLSIMVQILSSALAGAGLPGNDDIGHFFLALDPALFGSQEASIQYVDDLLHMIRSAEPSNPEEPIVIAGEPEDDEKERRLELGIPMPETLLEKLRALCEENRVPFILEEMKPR